MIVNSLTATTRRTVLKGAMVGVSILATPIVLRAQTPQFIRKNLMDTAAARDVESYRRGVAAMLALPPDHPHNWYRNALIHLMDCPHGNWWFYVWHRGYLGYLEQIIRLHSGDPEFALPYWDWTTEPRIPQSFFSTPAQINNALDPTSMHYESNFDTFDNKYKGEIEKFWGNLNFDQLHQENIRGFSSFNNFWSGGAGVTSNFNTPRSTGRSKTPALPDLTGAAKLNVRRGIIESGIKPTIFTTVTGQSSNPAIGFNSPETKTHHGGAGYAIIEGQPHNSVHVNIAGIMPTLLSTIDPIFFMHHCNIDRIWDIWTRRQIESGLSPNPTNAEAGRFYPEEFLFFIDKNKAPVLNNSTARDYMEVSKFGYKYTDGTGSNLVRLPQFAESIKNAPSSTILNSTFSREEWAVAAVRLSGGFANTLEAPRNQIRHIAHLSFVPPVNANGLRFDIYISPKGKSPVIGEGSPELAGSFEFFGVIHAHEAPTQITIDISDAFDRLKAKGELKQDTEIDFTVLAADTVDRGDIKSGVPIRGQLKSVSLEAI